VANKLYIGVGYSRANPNNSRLSTANLLVTINRRKVAVNRLYNLAGLSAMEVKLLSSPFFGLHSWFTFTSIVHTRNMLTLSSDLKFDTRMTAHLS